MKIYLLSVFVLSFLHRCAPSNETSDVQSPLSVSNDIVAVAGQPEIDWAHFHRTITEIKDEAGNPITTGYQEKPGGPQSIVMAISTEQGPDTMLTIDDGCHFLKYKVSVVNNSPRFIFKELTMIEPAWCSSEVNEKAFNLMKNILANLSAVEFSNMNCIFKGKSKDRFTAVDMEETDD